MGSQTVEKVGGMRRNLLKYLFAMIFLFFLSHLAVAKPVTLICSETDDLYAPPYLVTLDSNTLKLTITKNNHFGDEVESYTVEDVENQNGLFVVTATGAILNSHIVVIATGRKQISYTDAYTNRPLATDYCK
ncbi:hypothetical protein LBMAG20_16190 [Methylocystaceae bacterium]|nr:hypothetical protein LBMAG20_16190 [Methylocystaceae bacterium]